MLARNAGGDQDLLIQRGGIAVVVDLFKLAAFDFADPACAVLELDTLGGSACRGDEHDCGIRPCNEHVLKRSPGRALHAPKIGGIGGSSKAGEGAQEAQRGWGAVRWRRQRLRLRRSTGLKGRGRHLGREVGA